MPETYRFFDQVSYSEADQAEVQARMVRDGVLVGYAGELAVSAAGGFATVSTGEAFVQGFWYRNDAPKALPIVANTSSTPRVDMVVLHLDRVVNTLVATLHQGVLGAGAPALTQVVGGTWELPLASISTTSAGSVVTDARQWQTNVYNPMTTADDIIIAGVSGVPRRRAKGPNSSIFGVDSSGTLGYQTNTGSALAVLTDWKENTDLYGASGGSTWGAGVAQPFGTTKTFVVGNSGSLIEILVSVGIFNSNTPASVGETQSYMLVDGVRYELGSAGSNAYGNPFAGSKPVYISGLAPGNHTVQVYAWSNATTTGWYCRCLSQPTLEHYYLQVIEHKTGVGVQGPVGPAGSGMANPMTTLGDTIVGLAAGVPARIPKGANSTLFGIDGASNMGYRKVTPTDYSNPSTHRLNFNLGGVWWSNTPAGVGTFDCCNDQSFIVSITSLCLISTKGSIYWVNANAGAASYVHLIVDGNITAYLASAYTPVANVPISINWGMAYLVPLAAGTHTVRVGLVCSSSGNILYLDPGSAPYRHLYLGAAEFP